ncbi:TPA: nucleotide exchange factor GrpE [Candidatus Collierbacteria bacterium]|uniref:Protein GrpE n=1 Tax=Candidatus Collierbacteria bacterium GW2011_GWB2_44_22 TaxID=1618387 RepID=A0A0G1I0K1_9BACT|nr:MAG: Protein GrpE [Candidatus Collierbacteria bacterium GW2011_GWA2_44_13]KKT52353.1 MAG: Protein GrpE [Candidatus Collierbacteria bacterium GW2011_GWB2_44_22]KKT62017.1 MAG: Protein GrpE [Candidatus Collierbacteria bacterium GW2011_GWD1_44_27]KKT66386.1 MAG: Protein GrpE [Candidatus Collierbacteria bacterium GW2011_GWC2_44_30]KKT69255.1 MAG: Protein GrpE [Microgenomates group bacterium GW2011_GWC1_44_37]KKT88918.1 MAG: Protein GrpE [Candidatus Collierbacteria bacterium GW2011_GWD2_45_10]H
MVKKTSLKKTEEFVELKSRIEELENNYKRVLADYQNQQRRYKEQESTLIKMASASLIEKLLLNMDALEMAQAHLKDPGLKIIIDQFNSTLSQEGLSLIESDRKEFDPLIMDCTEVVPGKKDKVIETVSRGYYLFDKVLRPAKVKVGSGITN